MGELLRRRALMGIYAPVEPKPKYDLSGTYSQNKNGTTTITITGSHWKVQHSSSSGSGKSDIKTFPIADFYNINRRFVVTITNYTKVSGDPTGGNNPGQGIRIGYSSGKAGSADAAGMAYTLFYLKDGAGGYTKDVLINANASNRSVLWVDLPYHAAYTVEFDLVATVDGVWYF